MNVVIVMSGQEFLVGGTSCAAPAVSAILSLLNDVRIANHKPVLGYGFLTLIYQPSTSRGFVPITQGPAKTAGTCQGFKPAATGGWSPIVGFGGLNAGRLATIVAALN
jgi:tripeptidyl-peptidase-1